MDTIDNMIDRAEALQKAYKRLRQDLEAEGLRSDAAYEAEKVRSDAAYAAIKAESAAAFEALEAKSAAAFAAIKAKSAAAYAALEAKIIAQEAAIDEVLEEMEEMGELMSQNDSKTEGGYEEGRFENRVRQTILDEAQVRTLLRAL